jgi:Gpi18-like mannosyltransferase
MALRTALPPYLASRVLIGAAAVLTLAAVPPRGNVSIVSSFQTWDGAWYVSIADRGYLPASSVGRPSPPPQADTSVDGAVAYLPLYPLVVAAVGAILPVSLGASAVAIALLFGGLAAVAFTKLAAELGPEAAVGRAALLFCFFPGAFILSMAYPEGLLIFLGCVCLMQLRREAWVSAGITAGLASAVRPNGLALVVPCVVAAFIAIRRDRDWRSLAAPLLAPTGFVTYLSYLWWRTGEPGYWFRANRVFWHDQIGGWPELHVLLGGSHPQVQTGTDRALLIVGLAAGFLLLLLLVIILVKARLPAVVTSYALAYESLALLNQALAPRPRFIFAAFPLALALAFTLRGYVFDVVLAISSSAMVILFLFYTQSYLHGRFLVAP